MNQGNDDPKSNGQVHPDITELPISEAVDLLRAEIEHRILAAMKGGYIHPHLVAMILAEDRTCNLFLQYFWELLQCNRRGPQTVDVSHPGKRFYAWSDILDRICGLGVAGLTDGLGAPPLLLQTYSCNKDSNSYVEVQDTSSLGYIRIQDFKESWPGFVDVVRAYARTAKNQILPRLDLPRRFREDYVAVDLAQIISAAGNEANSLYRIVEQYGEAPLGDNDPSYRRLAIEAFDSLVSTTDTKPLFLRRGDLEDEALYRGANHTNRPRAFIGGLIQKACHREGRKISISKAYNFWKRLRKGETPAT